MQNVGKKWVKCGLKVGIFDGGGGTIFGAQGLKFGDFVKKKEP
jgi:hypothetical protein